MKMVFVNPQWQGGADKVTLRGAEEIEEIYLNNVNYIKSPVSERTDELDLEHDVKGFSVLKRQMEQALALLNRNAPQKLFSIGGSCDADIPAIAYLNQKYSGDLVVLWFDAHGDLNTPSESSTKLFYGMPARMLLDESGQSLSSIVERPLYSEQFMHIGGRDLDDSEWEHIKTASIKTMAPKALIEQPEHIRDWIHLTGYNNVHIHMDLDILEPNEFPHTPLSVGNGVSFHSLFTALQLIREHCHIVGFGLYKYQPCGMRLQMMEKLIEFGLSL